MTNVVIENYLIYNPGWCLHLLLQQWHLIYKIEHALPFINIKNKTLYYPESYTRVVL